ncbi:50S ribosomal protein L19 [Mesomycoplasma neurolyticum]|uniref:Large ribosomal subunit protein bL19 n=1 Tax=Mesomycoplasma neurolyticum TaxID=2120 RepID=A0A449A4Z9_9BACT|nr:50S ribosomal protein L19 [Mesomycoplasma neurolyticum]VEU59306.1 50S ribosomal protein L19 [Mesomycoplasma neurolyticum]
MQNKLISIVEQKQLRNDIPNFKVGDNVRVHVKIKENNKERIQVFEGLVIVRNSTGLREMFTVRKISYNVGIERTFPINSPLIEKIEVVRSNKVRRARLYFMRDRKGKSARLKEIRNKK